MNKNLEKNNYFYRNLLPELFVKIEAGKPVNYKLILLGLAEYGFSPSKVEEIFSKRSIGKKRYRISVNPECYKEYDEIKQLIGMAVNSPKVLAATKGQSHKESASGAFCLIHTKEYEETPCTIMIENGVPRAAPKLKRNLLMIENFEVFLKYKQVLTFIEKECDLKISLDDWDVIYTQGSAILNKQFIPLLMSYTKVRCLFDLDFGGLITYCSLRERLNTDLKFLYPKNIIDWLFKFGFKLPEQESTQLKGLVTKSIQPKNIKQLIDIIIKADKKLEQEVYLFRN